MDDEQFDELLKKLESAAGEVDEYSKFTTVFTD